MSAIQTIPEDVLVSYCDADDFKLPDSDERWIQGFADRLRNWLIERMNRPITFKMMNQYGQSEFIEISKTTVAQPPVILAVISISYLKHNQITTFFGYCEQRQNTVYLAEIRPIPKATQPSQLRNIWSRRTIVYGTTPADNKAQPLHPNTQKYHEAVAQIGGELRERLGPTQPSGRSGPPPHPLPGTTRAVDLRPIDWTGVVLIDVGLENQALADPVTTALAAKAYPSRRFDAELISDGSIRKHLTASYTQCSAIVMVVSPTNQAWAVSRLRYLRQTLAARETPLQFVSFATTEALDSLPQQLQTSIGFLRQKTDVRVGLLEQIHDLIP